MLELPGACRHLADHRTRRQCQRASPTPTSTLTAAEQQAVEEATEAVRAYDQTYLDILADPTPNINDINTVAAEPQLDIDLRNLQQATWKSRVT